MARKLFEFELYRLNLVDELDLLADLYGRPLRADQDIRRVIQEASSPRYDLVLPSGRKRHLWSIRYFRDFAGIDGRVIGITVARSVLEQEGNTVTDAGITAGVSTSAPPLAETVEMLFYMDRHLVAVERVSTLMQTHRWRVATEQVLASAARELGFRSSLVLEPKPEQNEIIQAFRSFTKLIRLRVYLRLPNPELNRYTQTLYDDLLAGGIREYLQDMRNPNGLSQEEDARPFASAAMAEQGYKEKEVLLEGYRDSRYEKVITGRAAAHGSIGELRDFVRGLRATAQTKESTRVLKAIAAEIDRIAPPERDVA
jgi:hypothetical protein